MIRSLENDAAIETALVAMRRSPRSRGEVFLQDRLSDSIEVKEKERLTTRFAERGLAVRLVDGRRSGFAHTTDLSMPGVRACVDDARRMARVTEGAVEELPDVPLDVDDLDIFDPCLQYERGRLCADAADAAEAAARRADPYLAEPPSVRVSSGIGVVTMATTKGVSASYRESYADVRVWVIVKADHERQSGRHWSAARHVGDLDPARVGQLALRHAVAKLAPRSLRRRDLTVVFDGSTARPVLNALAPLFSAENVLKGRSPFARQLGKRVASHAMTLIDDSRRLRGLRSAPFDGEGVKTTSTTLLDRGVVTGYLTSTRTARELGVPATGNTRRDDYRSRGRIAPSNLYIAPGRDTPAALLKQIARALTIDTLLNVHTVNRVSGEFSLGASGAYVEYGEVVHPVQGITLAGNLSAFLNGIVAVGDDLTFGPGGLGAPTVVVSGLSIGSHTSPTAHERF